MDLDQNAQGIIEALAAFNVLGDREDLADLIHRARQHLLLVQSHDVGSGDVNTDFGGDCSPQA